MKRLKPKLLPLLADHLLLRDRPLDHLVIKMTCLPILTWMTFQTT